MQRTLKLVPFPSDLKNTNARIVFLNACYSITDKRSFAGAFGEANEVLLGLNAWVYYEVGSWIGWRWWWSMYNGNTVAESVNAINDNRIEVIPVIPFGSNSRL
jgi:hypothetical protein